jgi:methylmalonyl-CoA mutase
MELHQQTNKHYNKKIPVLGITGTGGAGKSSVTDEIVRRYLNAFTDKTIAVVSVDPSKEENRRRFAGRPYPHEFHLLSPCLYAFAGHPGKRSGLSEHVQDALTFAGQRPLILLFWKVPVWDKAMLLSWTIAM